MPSINNRLNLVGLLMTLISVALIAQLLSFQFRLDPAVAQQLQLRAGSNDSREIEIKPNRGQIIDRDGDILAVNRMEYRIAISPSLVGQDRRETAKDLARALDASELDIYQALLPDENGIYPGYVVLKSPVTAEVSQAVADLSIPGIMIEPIPQRDYPQGSYMTQVLGFVNYNSSGYFGVEEYYQRELAGQSLITTESNSLLDISDDSEVRDGQTLQLTIDRDVQWIAQQVLDQAVAEYGALGGTILIMNPHTGEILAMVSNPSIDLEAYLQDPASRGNAAFTPAVAYTYEPGSTFKVLTAAAALDIQQPGLDLNWSYTNYGCEQMAGVQICDWDRVAKGGTTFTTCLVKSLNTCTSHWLVGTDSVPGVGSTRWYDYLQRFGFGRPTNVDIAGEELGIVNWPGTSGWNEANFVQTSFGQGIAVTPIQLMTAINSIANDGLMMQPHIVKRRIDGDRVFEHTPTPISRPISAATAQQVLRLMAEVVDNNGEGSKAQIENYQVAGKTGTSQKIGPDGRYSDTESWASFVGFIPANDPQISVLVLLDRPTAPGSYYGSQSAAPTFAKLAQRLVVLLDIPPDAVRNDLINAGGRPFDRE
ncbi:MAG: penicillin-binding protein 2 [Chloroflexi bacterium]|nr:penicillin-binding protein 2 [Chloroflexota bacterium]